MGGYTAPGIDLGGDQWPTQASDATWLADAPAAAPASGVGWNAETGFTCQPFLIL